jgi:hypothetical protein
MFRLRNIKKTLMAVVLGCVLTTMAVGCDERMMNAMAGLMNDVAQMVDGKATTRGSLPHIFVRN